MLLKMMGGGEEKKDFIFYNEREKFSKEKAGSVYG